MIKNKSVGTGLGEILRKREVSLLIVLFVMCVIVQSQAPQFLTGNNLNNMFRNYAHTIVLSFGMMLVLLIGGIDISVASTLAFCGMAGSMLMKEGFLPNAFSVYACATAIGLACGLLIGLTISKGKVIPIIATLGFQFILRGATYLVSDGDWVGTSEMLEDYKAFPLDTFLGVNNLIWVCAAIFVVLFIALKWTNFGRQIYAVGSNPEAAKVSGINIDRVKILVYTINGALAGLCGAIFTSNYASSAPNDAVAGEMDVIAACVIGGVSLNGGQGSAVGVLLGAITILVIDNGLPLAGVNSFWKQALKGAIILLAVVVNVLMERSSNRKVLKGREI